MVVAIKRARVPITLAAIRAVGPGIAVINNNFDLKSAPSGAAFCFPDLFSVFATDSVKTFINSAIADFHLVAVFRRTPAGTDKAGVRKISGGFTTKRSRNSSSRNQTGLFFVRP
jgi:hypothetical protein